MFRLYRHHSYVIAICLCACASTSAQLEPSRVGFLGVSLAGAEFGVEGERFSNRSPGIAGTDYVLNSARSLHYFSRKGVRLVRLPFRWERIQPRLKGSLDKKHLRELRTFCRHAKTAGAFVILDLHNYGRYRMLFDGEPRTCIIDEAVDGKVPVDRSDLADLWARLAGAFRDDSSVVGYAIMNEPHDMGASDWKEISQHAVDAIRRVDGHTTIVVAGDDWSSAERFRTANGEHAWIRDPKQNTVYEAHCYFDSDGSGKYQRSFASERAMDAEIRTRGSRRVRPFLEWCMQNNVRGIIGEFGIPADKAWKEVTELFLRECYQHDVPVCCWAGGEWWGKYPLSIQPKNEFRLEAPQLRWLREVHRSMTRSTNKK